MHGLSTLRVFAHCGFDALQSLDLGEASFIIDNVFCKVKPATFKDSRYRALLVNPKIQTLKIGCVHASRLKLLVQEIFPSLEHLTVRNMTNDLGPVHGKDQKQQQQQHLQTPPYSMPRIVDNTTLKFFETKGSDADLCLTRIPIRWLALITLKTDLRPIYGLSPLLEKMPRIQNVINSDGGYCDEVLPNNMTVDQSQEHRQLPWQQSIQRFDIPMINMFPYGCSSLFRFLQPMYNIVC